MIRIHRYYVYASKSLEILAVFHEKAGKDFFASLVDLDVSDIDRKLKKDGEIKIDSYLVRKSSLKKKAVQKVKDEEEEDYDIEGLTSLPL